jgi:hypothetical protein
MSDLIETLKSAKSLIVMDMLRSAIQAIDTVIEALQSGEPVAWLCDAGDGENINATCSLTALADYKRFGRKITPLYTTPQPVADVNQQLVDALKKAESHLVATMEHIDHWPRKFQEHHWQQVLDLRQALLSAGKENNTHNHTVAVLTEKWDEKTVTSAPFCIVCGESAGKGGEE